MKSFDDLTNQITPEIYENLRQAVEQGQWQNGVELTQEQRENCLQAMILWEHNNLPPEARTGYVPPKKTACGPKADNSINQPLKFKNE